MSFTILTETMSLSFDGDYGKRTITETNSGIDYGAVKLGVTVYF